MRVSAPVLLALLLTHTGCIRDELAVPAHEPGTAVTRELCLEPGYENQLWYDVASGTVMASNDKSAWDLSFESDGSGWRIRLNGSRAMWAWDAGNNSMDQPTDTVGMGAGRRYDRPSGHPDSTAIGDWRSGQHVYVIDMGADQQGLSMGLRKLQVLTVDGSAYTIVTAALDGTGVTQHTVAKDAQREYTMFSMVEGVVPIEPVQRTWDLVLTRFTTEVYQPIFLPYYQVTGFLTSLGTRVSRQTTADFDAVSLGDTLAHPFSTDRNAIGYDWKTYSFETNSYTVDPSIVYIIQDAEGYYHKLRFLDYYNQVGDIGCPQFEVVAL
ncbi:MAG TPA: HmuY family protein [Flavobacteriales bacterium]|nr:HmuY family protein [Flavobacteriales bacterium]